MSSLYIHIPFCKSKCLYCSFSSFSGKQLLFDRYAAALAKELEIKGELADNRSVLHSVFIGGGTPSCLPARQLELIISAIALNFQLDSRVEFSIEANPELLRSYSDYGKPASIVSRLVFKHLTMNN